MSAQESHEAIVERVKDLQRQNEAAMWAWNEYCDQHVGGVRDPKRHDSAFLCSFLESEIPTTAEYAAAAAGLGSDVSVITSKLSCLGTNQISLLMPSSEIAIMKEVVNANPYMFAPGRSCILREGDVLLDVGAHVGISAALALRTDRTRVVCVEPHPVTHGILQQNMLQYGERATCLAKAVSDTKGTRPLFIHRSPVGRPSRLFFSSLFDTRPHKEQHIVVECVPLQELVTEHGPTVVKIDAEGAECFLRDLNDFGQIRLIVAEWDWTHNRHRSAWDAVESHLSNHGFTIKLKGYMPTFELSGAAVLNTPSGNKRGNTGMIFVATREAPYPQTTAATPRH